MTDSDKFTAAAEPAAQAPIVDNLYATITDNTDPQFGRFVPLQSRVPYDATAQAYDNAATTYHDETQSYADVTATVTGAAWEFDARPIKLLVGKEDVSVTTNTALANIPATARYAEIYINAQNAGNIVWDIDGTTPNDQFDEDENGGVTIRLHTPEQIAGFRASGSDAAGVIDGSARDLGVSYYNISPEEMG